MLDEERTTLHVMDDQRRIAMIETKTVSGGSAVGSPVPRVRYQLDNHLGTAILELSDTAGIISYEEYHPYGTCAWWAGDSSIDVSRRRYRYTGMERDEETGLQYHSARYYAAWLGRWGSADPIGLGDGNNRFAYAHNQPINARDPSGLGTTAGVEAQDQRIDALLNDIDQILGSSEATAIFSAAGDESNPHANRAAAQYIEVLLSNTMEFIRENPDIITFIPADSDALPAGLAGQYDPEAGRILVREGVELSTIVHEFVHAFEAEAGPLALNDAFVSSGFEVADPLGFAAIVDKMQAHARAAAELEAFKVAHPHARRRTQRLAAEVGKQALTQQEEAIYAVGQFASEFDASLAGRSFELIQQSVAAGATPSQLRDAGKRLQSTQFRWNAFRSLDGRERLTLNSGGLMSPVERRYYDNLRNGLYRVGITAHPSFGSIMTSLTTRLSVPSQLIALASGR